MSIGKNITSQISLMLRYGLVGLFGTMLHFAGVVALVELAHLDPVISSALGFLLVLGVSYALNRTWTFRSERGGVHKFLRYTTVSLIGLGLNTGIMFATVHLLKWNYLYGQCLVVLVVPVSNFVLNRSWTFHD